MNAELAEIAEKILYSACSAVSAFDRDPKVI